MITLDFSGIDRITDRAIYKLELLKCEIRRESNPIPEMAATNAGDKYLRDGNRPAMVNAWDLAARGMRAMTKEEQAERAAGQYECMRQTNIGHISGMLGSYQPSALTGRQGLF